MLKTPLIIVNTDTCLGPTSLIVASKRRTHRQNHSAIATLRTRQNSRLVNPEYRIKGIYSFTETPK